MTKTNCSQLILCSGGLPRELESNAFNHLKESKVTMIYGSKDPYMNEERLKNEQIHANQLFPNNLTVIPFDGVHEMKPSIIESLV